MIKRFLIAIFLLLLFGGGLVGWNLFRDRLIQNIFANMPVPTVTVSTVEVKSEAWTPILSAIGTANASQGVDLAVETTGVVQAIRFQANQRVEKDAVLLQLDDAVQQAELADAKAKAALARTALERAQELRSRNVGSEATLEAAQSAREATDAQVARLEALLQQKQLRAPFSGIVGIPRVDLGQYLSSGAMVATLQDLDTLRADFSVPEQRLPDLRIGQRVRIQPGAGQAELPGEITGIDPKVDPSSRLVSVRARIEGAAGRITPGQFVQISVELPREDAIIALPQTAVVTSLYGDYVYVVRPVEAKEGETPAEGAAPKLEARQIFVTPGRRADGKVEIVNGLKDGDIVVTAGQNRLSNGTPVAIDNTINPADLKKQAAPEAAEAKPDEKEARAEDGGEKAGQ